MTVSCKLDNEAVDAYIQGNRHREHQIDAVNIIRLGEQGKA
jgi:hypothetical protein